ncbi:MAG: endo-1,4-beta-xylanase [Asticcacaulis sp.]
MLTRRDWITALAALAGTGLSACSQAAEPHVAIDPLKDGLPFPLGVAAMSGQLSDPVWAAIVRTHFSQITPEWEQKMEYLLLPDGQLQFDAPEALYGFARDNGMTMLGHTLIWYAQSSPWFEAVTDPVRFGRRYDQYISDIMTRFKGRTRAWDVVNEPVMDDGSGYRSCLWSDRLGLGYINRAYEVAHEADPNAVLFLNDYNLEHNPQKRLMFLKLAESLLKAGVPLGGLGTQSHIVASLAPGALQIALTDLASLGLPVHISELDISLKTGRTAMLEVRQNEARQQALVTELLETYATLPAHQRFGLTIWGARDKDSWLRRGGEDRGPMRDAPLMFDDTGNAKPLARTLKAELKRFARPV